MGVNKFRRPVMAPGYLDADGNPVSGGGDVPPATDDVVGGVLRVEYVASVPGDAALEDVIMTVNDLLAKLRASGVMAPVGMAGT